MNKLIKEQLNNVKIANVPDYSDTDGTMLLKKLDIKTDVGFVQGKSYNVELKDYIVHPYEGFTLHTNWNNDIVPTDTEMAVEVIQLMGKMIKVRGIGVNDGKFWVGWVPMSAVKIKEVIQ